MTGTRSCFWKCRPLHSAGTALHRFDDKSGAAQSIFSRQWHTFLIGRYSPTMVPSRSATPCDASPRILLENATSLRPDHNRGQTDHWCDQTRVSGTSMVDHHHRGHGFSSPPHFTPPKLSVRCVLPRAARPLQGELWASFRGSLLMAALNPSASGRIVVSGPPGVPVGIVEGPPDRSRPNSPTAKSRPKAPSAPLTGPGASLGQQSSACVYFCTPGPLTVDGRVRKHFRT